MKRNLYVSRKIPTVVAVMIPVITGSYIAFKGLTSAKPGTAYLQKLCNYAIQDKAFPGGVLIAGTRDTVRIRKAFGYHTYLQKRATKIDDIFDLASLTKVIATTSMAMKLYEEGKLDLNDPVAAYFPLFISYNLNREISLLAKKKHHTFIQPPHIFFSRLDAGMINVTRWKHDVTILHLLSHSSGLGGGGLYKRRTRYKTFRTALYHKLYREPGTATIYSDFNFIILAEIMKKVTGLDLDTYTQRYIFSPLHMRETSFTPRHALLPRIVPTEYKKKEKGFLKGNVHDPNAEKLRGVAGHAGLFSTADDLATFCQMILNKGTFHGITIFEKETIDRFTARARIVPDSSRCLGWDTPSGLASGGIYISDNSIGHTGYTGTSLWIDREYGIFVILLTNAVHPHYSFKYPDYFDWRQKIHSAVYEVLGYAKRNPRLKERKRWRSLF